MPRLSFKERLSMFTILFKIGFMEGYYEKINKNGFIIKSFFNNPICLEEKSRKGKYIFMNTENIPLEIGISKFGLKRMFGKLLPTLFLCGGGLCYNIKLVDGNIGYQCGLNDPLIKDWITPSYKEWDIKNMISTFGFGKTFLLLHELGHALLDHCETDKQVSDMQEDEADRFALWTIFNKTGKTISVSDIIDLEEFGFQSMVQSLNMYFDDVIDLSRREMVNLYRASVKGFSRLIKYTYLEPRPFIM